MSSSEITPRPGDVVKAVRAGAVRRRLSLPRHFDRRSAPGWEQPNGSDQANDPGGGERPFHAGQDCASGRRWSTGSAGLMRLQRARAVVGGSRILVIEVRGVQIVELSRALVTPTACR